METLTTMTYATTTTGALLVHVDYLFVYLVKSLREGGRPTTRVIDRRVLDLATFRGQGTTPNKVWLSTIDGEITGTACKRTPYGYYHPAFAPDPLDKPADNKFVDPYDQARPPTNESACITKR